MPTRENLAYVAAGAGLVVLPLLLNALFKRTNQRTQRITEHVESELTPKIEPQKPPTRKIKVIVIGCGNRGQTYANYALEHPDECEVVAIAEPRPRVREKMIERFKLNHNMVFDGWTSLLAHNAKFGRIEADAVIIAVQDRDHYACATALANEKYHMLLEKPLAPTEQECKEIVEAAERNNIMLCICHVMRYSQITQTTKQILDSGIIGDIVNIQHLEPVGFYHYAHSYVRGNWRNEGESGFMLLTKSCHDIDWICYIMGSDVTCTAVSSFGSLVHLRKENKPTGASDRCMTCDDKIESQCPYSAKKIYLDLIRKGYDGWPVKVIVADGSTPDIENVTKALEIGPYGRCAYECDNDVVDNQVVNMQFSNGATASFSMVAYTKEICERKTNIFGTKGSLEILQGQHLIHHFDFVTRTTRTIDCMKEWSQKMGPIRTSLTGHGYADYFLTKKFVQAVADNNPNLLLSDAKESLRTHKLVFQAEKARKTGTVITCV